jgi:hypothetical protein
VDKVEFSHPGDANTLSLVPREENGVLVADIPNVLLQSGNIIFVYLVHAPDGGVETTTDHVLRVIRRPKPADYVYTETEVLNYAYLDDRLKELEGEGLANAVADYLEKNPPQAGATEEEKKQIQQNKADIERLGKEKLDADKLPEAVREYLEENPVTGGAGIVVSETAPEDTSVLWVDTDDNEADNLQAAIDDALAQAKASGEFDGKDGKDGQNGSDYVLTEADKREIAELAAEMVDVPEGGGGTMQPLTFTGAVNATYDGSEAVTVNIPSGGGGGSSKFVLLHNETIELAEPVTSIEKKLQVSSDGMGEFYVNVSWTANGSTNTSGNDNLYLRVGDMQTCLGDGTSAKTLNVHLVALGERGEITHPNTRFYWVGTCTQGGNYQGKYEDSQNRVTSDKFMIVSGGIAYMGTITIRIYGR